MMLESYCHSDTSFVTLTYSDEHVPFVYSSEGNGAPLMTLNPEHTKNFMKRLRKRMEPQRIRFKLVGEYGDETERPHYHAAFFGVPSCAHGNSVYSRSRTRCCAICDTIRDAWGMGNVFSGQLTEQSSAYIAGYILKKMTDKGDFRLNGRYPEYSRQSNRPGIGADFMHEVASTLLTFGLESQGDVPSSLRHGKREMPLGRYLTRKLREAVGKAPGAPEEVLNRYRQEMQDLRARAFDSSASVTETYLSEVHQRLLSIAARQKILKQWRSL